MVAMLCGVGARGYCIKEDMAAYGFERIVFNSDFDSEEIKPQ